MPARLTPTVAAALGKGLIAGKLREVENNAKAMVQA